MKFFKQALSLLLITSTSVEASRKTFSKQDFADAVAAGRVDQRKLLENAIPYQQALRRRAEEGEQGDEGDYQEEGDGDANYEYERPEVTSNYRLQFNSCLTLETENYNLLLDNLVSYSKSGALLSIRNYILFDVCDGDNCNAETWMVDLGTFIEAVVSYGPSRKQQVCEACIAYGEDVCGNTYYYNGKDYNNYEGNGEGDDGERKLQMKYELFDGDMCDECETYQCAYDSEGEQEEDFDAIEEWITEIAQCKQTDTQWQGLNTYAGWMCNADGSGIEIGVFIDNYCRMYARNLQYSSIMNDEDYQYFFQSQDVIPFMFTDIIQCENFAYVQYVDEETYGYFNAEYGDDYQAADNGYNYQYRVSNACMDLFYGDFIPRSMSYCGDEKEWTDEELAQMQQENQQNGQQQQYEGQYQYNDNAQDRYNGQNMYQYIQASNMMYNTYGQDASWYSFDLSAFQILDGAAVCGVVKDKWESAGYSTGKSAVQQTGNTNIQNAFNEEHSNNGFWKWQNGKSSSKGGNSSPEWLFPTRNNNSIFQTANTKLSPMEIAWIVIASMVATAVFMHMTRKQVLKRKAKNAGEMQDKEVYHRTNDKGNPLIIS